MVFFDIELHCFVLLLYRLGTAGVCVFILEYLCIAVKLTICSSYLPLRTHAEHHIYSHYVSADDL